jgi:hypothetical protein
MRQLSSEMLQFFIHVHFFMFTYDLPSEVFANFTKHFMLKKAMLKFLQKTNVKKKILCKVCATYVTHAYSAAVTSIHLAIA